MNKKVGYTVSTVQRYKKTSEHITKLSSNFFSPFWAKQLTLIDLFTSDLDRSNYLIRYVYSTYQEVSK